MPTMSTTPTTRSARSPSRGGVTAIEPGNGSAIMSLHRRIKDGDPDTPATRRDGGSLLEEISELVGLQVYTQNGVFLGNVNNVVVDVENGQVDGLFVQETNPLLVEGSRAVSVPYRWIQSVGDIVVLRYFPKRVSLKKSAAAK